MERGDFACGASQASAMMIWGGLVYLKDMELANVWRLSASRDRMIDELGAWVRARTIHYVPIPGGRSRAWVQLCLYLYWLMCLGRRSRPRYQTRFPEQIFLHASRLTGALSYEEAVVESSDAQFVLQWLLPHDNERQVALNYCALGDGGYQADRGVWQLELTDTLSGQEAVARTRWVVNAAGGWTDAINRRFERPSPYRHVLSKGVSIGVPRDPHHQHHLAFENGLDGNAMTLIPWGPVSLWGSTDTVSTDMTTGGTTEPVDIHFLLEQLNQHLARTLTPEDVISLRCGIRPLVINRRDSGAAECRSPSRGHRLYRDPALPWISVYGGKLTYCIPLAQTVCRWLQTMARPTDRCPSDPQPVPCPPQLEAFPGLSDPVPTAAWCLDQQRCWTLEDYLRRRTNIAQWVPRGGLGRNGEHAAHLLSVARVLCGGDENRAQQAFKNYQQTIQDCFDQVLAAC